MKLLQVIFTYDVIWEVSNIPWAHRWDIYLSARGQGRIQLAAIMESVFLALFLAGVVAAQLTRMLRRDIEQYNSGGSGGGRLLAGRGVGGVEGGGGEDGFEEQREETGWKLVHADVFRPPRKQPMLFSVCVGTGCQLVSMTVIWLVFAVLGALSPS
ncbi:unnamed protein product, partial [Discosporangium mesarthrocarpum]